VHRVAFQSDHPLDQRSVWIKRGTNHHQIARPRVAQQIDQPVDDDALPIVEGRLHRVPDDARQLKWKCCDQAGQQHECHARRNRK
jgi:hypothetical protein